MGSVTSPADVPAEIQALADERAAAREAKDWARSDELRDALAAAGWLVRDAAGGSTLTPAPPYALSRDAADLARIPAVTGFGVVAGIIVDGWGDDLVTCVEALLAHSDAGIVLLDNASDAADTVHAIARAHPDRVFERHLERPIGWSAATVALMDSHDARVHVSMDPSSVLTGDAITPLVEAIADDVVAAGWQGADVDTDDAWRSVTAAGPGEVDVLLGYLMAVDREAGLAHPPHPKAAFYRNADLEWSLILRAAGFRLVVPAADLPVRQDRHHGYHDSDETMRDRESKKTYDRILAAFRGKVAVLRPRG